MVPATSAATLTPQRSANASLVTPNNSQDNTPCRTPLGSSTSANYRLLYRGTLSLPDSYLLLDGLTFNAHLESPMKHHLLENPLALALESMRGRQSLRYLGTVKLRDVWLDESGNIEMDIHPRAVLSKIYFENIFCLLPYPPAPTSHGVEPVAGNKSELGIKIALGDTDGPETTQIVVFGQITSLNTRSIKLRVARVMHHPPPRPIPSRVPRPDDPTPRRPPMIFQRTNSVGAGALKRTASLSSSALSQGFGHEEGVTAKRQKLSKSNKDLSKATADDKVFKVPSLPGKAKGKAKDNDVFGPRPLSKKMSNGDASKLPKPTEETEVERANKELIKKSTLEYLLKTKDPTLGRTVDRGHPEFKEIWAWINGGVGFALRAHIKITRLALPAILPLIETHARMYIGETQDDVPSNVPS